MNATTTEERDNLIALAQRHLSNRLHGLARRTETMDTVAIVDMHRHLDAFKAAQKDRVRLEAPNP